MAKIWAQQALLESGWANDVLITVGESGTIETVEPDQKPSGTRTGILLPAPANGHSHSFQRAMAGLSEYRLGAAADSFWTWRALMFRFLEHLTPDHVRSIAAWVQLEMLESGFAAQAEFHYLHHQPNGRPYNRLSQMAESIVEAAAMTGIGLTLLPVHYQFGGCDERPLTPGQIRFGNDFDQFARLHSETCDLVQKTLPSDCLVGVAPHSLRAVRTSDLKGLQDLAGKRPFHMHLAEQPSEVEEVLDLRGARPVEWVLDHLALDSHCCMIHCTQMLHEETIRLAASGAIVGLCPITESNLGDGIFDGVNWLDAGGRFAIGSDSNIRISLVEELRTLEYSQRLRDGTRAALASEEISVGRRLFEIANSGGALALGRDSGLIAVGKLADLVALNSDRLPFVGISGDRLLDTFIFAGDDRFVTDVWSAGRHVVVNGRHYARDSIMIEFLNVLNQLRELS